MIMHAPIILVARKFSEALAKGGRLLAGGEALDQPGNFHTPTVVDNLSEDVVLLNEEPFGPIAALIPFDDIETAIAQSNAVPYGLAAYCYSNSPKTQHLVANGLHVGLLGINTPKISVPETPFGGVGQSGNGSEGGTEGVASYMTTKYVSQFVA